MSGTNIYGELIRAQLQQSASALTPTANGLVYYDTALNTARIYTAEGWKNLGSGASGAGEINAVLNPSVAEATTGWTNGTSHTLTRVTSGSPLDPIVTTALSIAASATATESSTSGEYYSISSLASGLRNKKLKLEFYFTTEASQTWAVSVWQGSTRISLSTDSSGATTLPAGTTGKFSASIFTDSSAAYTVNFTRTAGSGTATLLLTSVILGPGIQPQGSVVGAVNQFATTIGGLGSGSVVSSTTDFFYYRVGENMIAWGAFTKDGTAGTGSADVTMTIPSGLTINTSYLTESSAVSSQINRLGPWNIRNASGKYGHVNPSSTTTLRFSRQDTGSSDLSGADVGSGAVLAFGPLVIPISEWAGSGTVNLAQNDVEAIFSTATTTTAGASDLISFGYGPQGVAFNSIDSVTVSSVTTYRVRAQKPLGPLDFPVIQTSRDRNIWNVVGQDGSVGSALAANTANYGMSLLRVSGSTTDIDIVFGNNGRIPGTTYGGNGLDWSGVTSLYWRVLIVRSGQAVGFGQADAVNGIGGLTVLPYSMIRLNTGNGFGSTNTKIRRFTTTVQTVGSDITYADSATLGATFTINRAGVYSISFTDRCSAIATIIGISKNSTQLTTNIDTITAADRLVVQNSFTTNAMSNVSVTVVLAAGDVIRAHAQGAASSSTAADETLFTITQVARF